MTYIEREALFKKQLRVDNCNIFGNYYGAADVVLVDDIKGLPAADVVPVVRCKDCKYYGFDDGIMWCSRHRGLAGVRPDAFCSYGVKRED